MTGLVVVKHIGPEEAEQLRMDVWDILAALRAAKANPDLIEKAVRLYRRLAESADEGEAA
jgi:hypothetical protein